MKIKMSKAVLYAIAAPAVAVLIMGAFALLVFIASLNHNFGTAIYVSFCLGGFSFVWYRVGKSIDETESRARERREAKER